MTDTLASVDHVAPVFRVADLDRSIRFYRDRLGFELEFVHAGFYASLRRGGGRIHLNCGVPVVRDQAALERAEHIDVCFVVPSAAAIWAQFEAAGVVPWVALRAMPYGREFYLKDPDGYLLGFVEPAPG